MNATPEGPRASAEAAGLRYVDDSEPGITRRTYKHGFSYFSPEGRKVRDDQTLQRIQELAVPPAWEDVWICADPDGHLQATGVDQAGRKQYRYHPAWRERREQAKFDHLAAFGEHLPELRARVAEDLQRQGLPREKVLAAAVELMDRTLMRVGNEAYARANDSYGLVTLEARHVALHGSEIELHYKGKGDKEHDRAVRDPTLADVLGDCHELPGQRLFEYEAPDGEVRVVHSHDVNAYIQETLGAACTSKEFRTWGATVLAASLLCRSGPPTDQDEARRQQLEALDQVAEALGNTRRIAEDSYVHPAVLAAHEEGRLQALEPVEREGLGRDERVVLALLQD